MNLSGVGINKAFKTGAEPVEPYYYVTGTLDLANTVYNGTYYFNFDNDFSYSTTRDYYNFIIADSNSVISEVTVYASPDLDVVDEQKTYFAIGGADYTTNSPVKVWWAAPPGFGPLVKPPVSAISKVERNGTNVATITTVAPHGLYPGEKVTVSCNVSGFNETNKVILSTPTLYKFTYANTGATYAEASATGTVTLTSGAISNGYPLSVDDLMSSPVSYFGHDGGHFPYGLDPSSSPFAVNTSKSYKYLAVTILNTLPTNPVLPPIMSQSSDAPSDSSGDQSDDVIIVNDSSVQSLTETVEVAQLPRSIKSSLRKKQRQLPFKGLPPGDKAVNSGRLTVTLKIYPKAQ